MVNPWHNRNCSHSIAVVWFHSENLSWLKTPIFPHKAATNTSLGLFASQSLACDGWCCSDHCPASMGLIFKSSKETEALRQIYTVRKGKLWDPAIGFPASFSSSLYSTEIRQTQHSTPGRKGRGSQSLDQHWPPL